MRPILDALEEAGGPLGPLMTSARTLLHDPAALLPVATAGMLFEEAERHSGRSDFAFRVGERSPLLELGEWGKILAQSPTVADLLFALVYHAPRFNSGERFWIARRGNDIHLHLRFTSRLTYGRRAAHEYTLMLLLQAIRLAAGLGWRPGEIHLEGAPPAHAAVLAAQAEQAICFQCPGLTIVFPARVAALRFPNLSLPAPAAAVAPTPCETFEGSIRQVVEALLKLGAPELPIAAEIACMSERSFQRRLTECGLSFTRLVDEARFESARRLLADRSIKIAEISAELGYTDSANFTRAFRRWSGMPPQVFRSFA